VLLICARRAALCALCVWLAEWICPCLEIRDVAIFGSQKKFAKSFVHLNFAKSFALLNFEKNFTPLEKFTPLKNAKKTLHKKFCKKILHP
jgi:hypothetical protein